MRACMETYWPDLPQAEGVEKPIADAPKTIWENIDKGIRIVECWESKAGTMENLGRVLAVEIRTVDALGKESWVLYNDKLGVARGSKQELMILRLIDLLVHNNT